MSKSSNRPQADTRDDAFRQAGAAAMRLLARREHSAQELHHKLTGRGYSPSLAQEVIANLRKEGSLSDYRFIESYLQSRFERGFGPVRIEAELRERGIDAGQAASAVSDSGFDWMQSACRQREKRFGSQLPEDFSDRARQMRFLQQRGFDSGQIRSALAGKT